jgi:hypothetical protein
VQANEAEQVRHIMRRYLALGSVPALVEGLEREDTAPSSSAAPVGRTRVAASIDAARSITCLPTRSIAG